MHSVHELAPRARSGKKPARYSIGIPGSSRIPLYQAGIQYRPGIKIPGWEGARASQTGNEIYFHEMRFEDLKELAESTQILELQVMATIYSYHIW